MGQQLTTSNKRVIKPVVDVFLMKYFPHFQFKSLLNNGVLIKTALVYNESENEPLVVRMYFKEPDSTIEDKVFYNKHVELIKEFIKEITIKDVMHIAPVLLFEDHLQAGMIVRQFYMYNLKERMHLMPYLTNIDKKWLSFQLLFALKELNSLKTPICHGDIKLENILMTSRSSLYLSDITTFKPAYIPMDDMTSYTFYFRSNSGVKSCYLAPERLVEGKITKEQEESKITPAMDIFSAGAVISELFTEELLFDYTKLIAYKKGEFALSDSLKKIQDEKLRNTLTKMLDPNPLTRITLDECLNAFANEICPIGISKLILPMNTLIITTSFYKPDLQIGLIYQHWIQIWKVLFGLKDPVPVLNHKLKYRLINKLILKDSFNKCKLTKLPYEKCKQLGISRDVIMVRMFESLIHPTELTLLYNEDILSNEIFNRNDNSDPMYIILNYIFQSMENLQYDSTMLVMLEMIKAFAMKVPDLIKIQLISPYLVTVFRNKEKIIENNTKKSNMKGKEKEPIDQHILIRSYALRILIDILKSINYDELYLPSGDYYYFDSYVFPFIVEKIDDRDNKTKEEKDSDLIIIIEIARVLDIMVDLGDKFLNVMLRSRIKNYNVTQLGKEESIEESIRQSQNANEERRENSKEMIFQSYDIHLKNFKDRVFQIIENLISRNKIELVQILLRKFPALFQFFGKRKTENLTMLLINLFNTTDWIILREMFILLPSIVNHIFDSSLYDSIISCFDFLISKGGEDLQVYELIKTFNELIKNDDLQLKEAVKLLALVKGYTYHPNMWIRNETIDFISNVVSKLTPEEVLCYFYKFSKELFIIPVFSLTKDIFLEYSYKNVSRVFFDILVNDYDLSINDASNYNKDSNDSQQINTESNQYDKREEERLRMLLKDIIAYEKSKPKLMHRYDGNILDNDEDYNYNNNEKNINLTPNRISTILKNEFEKFLIEINDEDITTVQESYLIKITAFLEKLSPFPKIQSRNDFCFQSDNDNFLGEELFNIKYYFKALSIFAKYEKYEKIIHQKNNKDYNSIHLKLNSPDRIKNYSNYKWKPQGKILSTLYKHSTGVERLLPNKSNHFISIDSNGGFVLWEIAESNNLDELVCTCALKSKPDYIFPIKYNKTICSIDKNNFIFASDHQLYQYTLDKAQLSKGPKLLYSSPDNKDIICVITAPNSQSHLDDIVFVNQNNTLSIIDQRMDNITGCFNLPFEKGMISCMCLSQSKDFIYIGTMSGLIYCYDFRLNSVTCSYKYSNESPIIGLEPYIVKTKNNVPYLIVWTGTEDHEVCLWNMDTLHCDILFKVNSINGTDSCAFLMDLPTMSIDKNSGMERAQLTSGERKQLFAQNNELDQCFNSIITYYPYIAKSNIVKSLLFDNSLNKQDYVKITNERLKKLVHIYKGSSTVQKVLIPKLCSQDDNQSFIISAGNDMIMRYWDLEDFGNKLTSASFIINGPNNLKSCTYSKVLFDNTIIIQSNEFYNTSQGKKDIPGFSEYQNFNCTQMNSWPQKEFDASSETLRNCTKLANAAHQSVISDLLSLSLDGGNVLISSSWDGTVKIWR